MVRGEQVAIAVGGLLLVALPAALHGGPATVHGTVFTLLIVTGGLVLAWWRTRPREASVLSLGLFLAAVAIGGWFPDTGVAVYSAAFVVLALGWSGRAAWLVAACAAAYLVPFYQLA